MRACSGRVGWPVVWTLLAVMAAAGQAPSERERPGAPPAAAAASLTPEVDQHYRVDAGDVLEVVVPRYPEFTKLYPVTQSGAVVLDLLGEVTVRGLTTAEIARKLATALSEYLRHAENLSVRVVGRRMLVRVVGHVASPGLKEVPKDSNVQEVLAVAGGPQLGALLSRIVVRRKQGEWVEEIPVDLKAYVEGRGALPVVQNGDEVFVPMVTTDGSVQRPLTAQEILDPTAAGRVQVLGAVRQPGEVALKDGGTLLTVLTGAGGWLDTADLSRLRRVVGGVGEAQVIDLQSYLEEGGTLPPLEPGDVLTVPSRVALTRTVRVLGAVEKPGPVQLPAEADLQTALAAAGGALPYGDTRHIRLVRTAGTALDRREVDLEAWLSGAPGATLPELRNGDTIFVPKGTLPVATNAAVVYVFGAITRPGPYALVEQRPLLHALALAGGTLPTANLRKIKISRAGTVFTFDLQAFQDGQGQALPDLRDGDVVTIEPNTVSVVGNVARPGPVEVKTKATVVEAIAAAGGPAATADLSRVVLSRAGDDGVERLAINLEQYLYEPEQAPPLPEVRAGDVVSVAAGTADAQVAYVLGAVQRPGLVNLPGRRASVLYALAQAGGVLPTADREQVRIIRPGAGGLQVEIFDLKALLGGQAAAGDGQPPAVQPGDVVAVDELGKPGRGVLVLGAVARQGRLLVEDGQTVIDTIGLAGGLLPNADPSHAKLIRASGEVLELDLTSFTKTGAPSPRVADGDVFVVAYQRDSRTVWDDLLRIFPFVSFFMNL